MIRTLEDILLDDAGDSPGHRERVHAMLSRAIVFPRDLTLSAVSSTPGLGHTSVQHLCVALAQEVDRLASKLDAIVKEAQR